MRIDPKKLDLHLARACMSKADLRNGTSPQTLLRIRRGMEVKPKTVGKIALALGVDVIDIIKNTAATVDNDEPLTDTEVQEYELQPEKHEFTVRFTPDNKQIGRIHKLLVKWREYVAEDETKPFADYTIEKFFEVMMQVGSLHTINRHIENMEFELKEK